MSDLELRKFGQAAKLMADPSKNFGTPNPAFKIQLDEARTEWRRRHPRTQKLNFMIQLAPKLHPNPLFVSVCDACSEYVSR
jgi:hypothetical protein